MEKYLKMKIDLVEAEKEVDACKLIFLKKKRELIEVESKLVSAKENKLRLEEQADEFHRTKIGEFSLDEHRIKQISDYKERATELMKKIENEPMLTPLGIGGLISE